VSAKRRVLVVDDDAVSRLVLAHMVGRLGHEAVPAEDIPEALAAAGAGVDLVLSDFCLPAGTGVQLLARLRADGVTAPFVLVTGVAEVAAPDGAAAGVADVAARLTKPVDSRRLAACLAGVLGPGP
jgi:CheY-like chemotaxis protein